MKINIVKLNILDNDCVHLSKRAWQHSRTGDTSTLPEILSLNLPANEIPNAVLEVECSIIEREIIASMRDHHMWARSSRVDDPIEFEMHPLIAEQIDFHAMAIASKDLMREAKNIARQDEYRLLMPVMALTKFTLSINLRSLILLQKFFIGVSQTKSFTTPNFPVKVSMDAAYQLGEVIDKMTVGANLSKYPTVNVLPEVKEMTSGRTGGFITYSGTIGFSLRTHLIRHRMLFMNDNLLEIITSPTFDELTLESPVKVNITSSIDFWKRIVSTRSCWLTHYRMWKEIVETVSQYIDEDIENILPCSNGQCPFSVDNNARLDDKDPNPPCPIYTNEKELLVSKRHVVNMYEQLMEDKRPEFWQNHIGKVEK